MRAAILAAGSELLGTDRLDTNSLRITEELGRYGVEVGFKCVVGDDLVLLADEITRLSGRYDLLLLTGGLGPTEDDLTREAVARAFDRALERSPTIEAEIESKFARMGFRMPEVNRKQADVVAGAEVIPNPRGTAPGQVVETAEATLFLFPGVPTELEGMLSSHLLPWLDERCQGRRTEMRVLCLACVPESTAEERLRPFYDEFGREGFSVLASPGQVTLQLTRGGNDEDRLVWLGERVERLREIFGSAVFADVEGGSLEKAVGDLLRRSGATVVTAESCTAGLIAERLTRVPGSSHYFLGGAVTYSDELKKRLLGVREETLETHGAVSEQAVREMAAGARTAFGADYALAVSGIAGPGGGSDEKPVGTVQLALAVPGGEEDRHRKLVLPGDRERVRWLSSQWALDMLRLHLGGKSSAGS